MTRENRLEPRDLVLSSTTETQEALDHAVSENWEKPFVPRQKKEEPKDDKTKRPVDDEAANDKSDEDATDDTEGNEESADGTGSGDAEDSGSESEEKHEEEEKPKGKLGWSKRVNKLTARNARLQSELDEERRKREDIEARLSRLESGKAPEKIEEGKPGEVADLPNKPQRAQFKSDEEFISSLVKWERANEEHKANVAAENNRMKDIFDAHRERTSEARERYDDWDEVADSAKNMRIHPTVEMAIMEMENSADVLYHLATHPETYEKLEGMTVFQGISEMTRISDKLAARTQKAAAPKKQRPSLDEPIEPTRRPAKSSKKLEEIKDPDEYIAARRQMRQARQRVS